MTAAHAEKLFTLLQDEAIYTWISAVPPQTLQELQTQWMKIKSRVSPAGTEAWLDWAVRRRSDGKYVGKIDAEVDSSYVATNLGYMFFPEFWGNGYAYEAVSAVVHHFAKHSVNQIRATVTVGNDASARLLEKAAFVRTRIIPDNDVIRGIKFDDIEFVRTFEHDVPLL